MEFSDTDSVQTAQLFNNSVFKGRLIKVSVGFCIISVLIEWLNIFRWRRREPAALSAHLKVNSVAVGGARIHDHAFTTRRTKRKKTPRAIHLRRYLNGMREKRLKIVPNFFLLCIIACNFYHTCILIDVFPSFIFSIAIYLINLHIYRLLMPCIRVQ